MSSQCLHLSYVSGALCLFIDLITVLINCTFGCRESCEINVTILQHTLTPYSPEIMDVKNVKVQNKS